MVLSDWNHEVPDATICERYSIGPGDIHALVESVNWLLHATGRLARMFKRGFSQQIGEFELCMRHGIKRELIPLVRIRNIGRVRARRLFNNGFTSPEKILAAGEERIVPILGQGITTQVFSWLKEEMGGRLPVSQQVSQADLFQFGKKEPE
jgi:helicase